jgi:hypothetical protein
MVAQPSQPGILAPCLAAGRSIAGGSYRCQPIAGGRLDLPLLKL